MIQGAQRAMALLRQLYVNFFNLAVELVELVRMRAWVAFEEAGLSPYSAESVHTANPHGSLTCLVSIGSDYCSWPQVWKACN
jgi:hypothetical protein